MKRRKPPTWMESLRVWIWPRRSWLRSGQYVAKRIMRLTATPHAVSAGVAVGAFTSFTPFMGLHFALAFVLAWVVRGNMIAAALGTFVGNPLTFPFIWAATYQTGHFVLQTQTHGAEPPALGAAMKDVMSACMSFDGSAALAALGDIWFPILYPMLVGGLIVGPLVALPIYFLTRRAAGVFRETRRNKLMAKATELRDKAKQLAERTEIDGKAERA
ncbi:MAG: DUF2062 domain-containing protein [Rhizobiaceae bacterium]